MITLDCPNFAPEVRKGLTAILNNNKNTQTALAGKPYIVTDWDNTAIIFDSQQSLFLYQIDGLHYRLRPERFREIIEMDLMSEQKEMLKTLLLHIGERYERLYQQYEGMAGDKSLAFVKESKDFFEFKHAMACLYKYPLGHLVECCRILYLFENYTNAEVKRLTKESLALSKLQKPHPEIYYYNAGGKVFQAVFYMGMKKIPEQAEFFQKCQQNGIAVYVCSASHQAVVEAHAEEYQIPTKNVYALYLEKNADGTLKAEIKKDRPYTVQEGKADTIEAFLVPNHQREPLLIMGDSLGDVGMMNRFDCARVVVHTKYLEKVKLALGEKSFLVQGRDEAKGQWTADESFNPII